MSKKLFSDDEYAYIFKHLVDLPDIESITLDKGNFDMINPEIVNLTNIWPILVMTSMLTKNSGMHVLRKDALVALFPHGYSGEAILEAAKERVVVSSTPTAKTTMQLAWDAPVFK